MTQCGRVDTQNLGGALLSPRLAARQIKNFADVPEHGGVQIHWLAFETVGIHQGFFWKGNFEVFKA